MQGWGCGGLEVESVVYVYLGVVLLGDFDQVVEVVEGVGVYFVGLKVYDEWI